MLSKITKGLFFCILVELTLGGGGRLTAFGLVSLRMILFGIAMIITLINVLKGTKISTWVMQALIIFTVMLFVGVIVGLMHGADKKFMWEDVKPLLYFYLLPFFSFAITDWKDVERVGKIILTSACILAVAYLALLVVLHSGNINFLDIYEFLSPTEEFFFRGEVALFYKGFLFLCIGFLIADLFFEEKKWIWMVILSIAVLLTFTRGFLLSLTLTYLFYFILKNQSPLKIGAFVLAGLLIVVMAKEVYAQLSMMMYEVNGAAASNSLYSQTLLGDRDFSDNERVAQIKAVAKSITPVSAGIGHGFGIGTSVRPVHMEISYLEIFHKQGLVGLGCWASLLFSFFKTYQLASDSHARWAILFFMAGVLVFFESLTNQYINNPIGLGMFMISFTCLQTIKQKNE